MRTLLPILLVSSLAAAETTPAPKPATPKPATPRPTATTPKPATPAKPDAKASKPDAKAEAAKPAETAPAEPAPAEPTPPPRTVATAFLEAFVIGDTEAALQCLREDCVLEDNPKGSGLEAIRNWTAEIQKMDRVEVAKEVDVTASTEARYTAGEKSVDLTQKAYLAKKAEKGATCVVVEFLVGRQPMAVNVLVFDAQGKLTYIGDD